MSRKTGIDIINKTPPGLFLLIQIKLFVIRLP